MKTTHHGQMSESFLTAVFLSLSGGLQDAYTYLFRGKVFANAQTGETSVVLTRAYDWTGRGGMVLHDFIPLCAFAFGVLVAAGGGCASASAPCSACTGGSWSTLGGNAPAADCRHFLPAGRACNLLAKRHRVDSPCAMQVQAFRKVDGYAFASTMCIGDLRSGAPRGVLHLE